MYEIITIVRIIFKHSTKINVKIVFNIVIIKNDAVNVRQFLIMR